MGGQLQEIYKHRTGGWGINIITPKINPIHPYPTTNATSLWRLLLVRNDISRAASRPRPPYRH